MSAAIFVYGAYGHTGRFVLAELQRRGWTPIAAGRDRTALAALDPLGVTTRRVTLDDLDDLLGAVGDARAILNCAGPFGATVDPLIATALRAGVPYLDISGQSDSVASTFEDHGAAAEERGIVVMPAAGFFGALGDLLASAALDGRQRADAISIAYALDEWKPTPGTRRAMQQMGAGRLVFRNGQLTVRTTPPPVSEWVFPQPVGPRATIGEYPSPETVLIPRHIATPDVDVFMAVDAIRDLRDPDVGRPIAVDDDGRSAQRFMVVADVVHDGAARRVVAEGRDIYATTAPILVECMERILDSDDQPGGVVTPGDRFPAHEVLAQLARHDMQITSEHDLGGA
jgi:short subunit dehydrogenase-like uncharacterized protein